MTLVTLRPDSTVSSSGLAAGNPHTALSDNSDGTTVGASGSSAATATMTLGTSTLPAGAVTKSLTARLRAKATGPTPGAHKMRLTKSDGTVLVDWYDQSWGSSLATRSSSSVAWTGTQADIDGLRAWLHVNSKQTNPYSIVAAEAYCDLRYVAQPTVTLDSAVVTLDALAVGWTYSQPDSDGGAQAQWVVRVFTADQYGAGGFNADTSTALAEASGTGTTNTATITGLPDGTLYKVYVRAADVVNGTALWSAWVVSSTFSVTTTRAEVLSVTPTATPATARVDLAVTRDTGKDAWVKLDAQRASSLLAANLANMDDTAVSGVAGGWGSFTSGTLTPTYTIQTAAGRGNVQRVAVTGMDPGERAMVRTTTAVSLATIGVAPGDTIEIGAMFAALAGSYFAGCQPSFGAEWYTGDLLVSSSYSQTPGADTAGSYYPYTGRVVVPAGVTHAKILVGLSGGTGASNATGQVDIDAVTVIRADTWTTLGGSPFTASGNSATITDRLAAPDRPLIWRVRAVNSSNAAGSWIYSPVASYTPTAVYLRDANAPTNEVLLSGWQPDGFPDDQREIPTASLDVIGRTDPVVVWDVPKYRSGSFRVDVASLAESDALTALLDGRRLMILQPAILGPSMLIQPTGWTRERTAEQIATEGRYVTVDYIQVG